MYTLKASFYQKDLQCNTVHQLSTGPTAHTHGVLLLAGLFACQKMKSRDLQANLQADLQAANPGILLKA
jgi:hypothetical protein